jgi:hypothetical protein
MQSEATVSRESLVVSVMLMELSGDGGGGGVEEIRRFVIWFWCVRMVLWLMFAWFFDVFACN